MTIIKGFNIKSTFRKALLCQVQQGQYGSYVSRAVNCATNVSMDGSRGALTHRQLSKMNDENILYLI